MPVALFGINDGSGPGRQSGHPLPGRRVDRARLVDLPRRPPPDRRPVLVTTCHRRSLFPFVGTVIYTILRPPEFLEDQRERELEMQASELRMRQLDEQSCPRCEHPDRAQLAALPRVPHRLKDPCYSCSQPVDPRWAVCPYCETPLRRASTASSERSPRAPAPATRPRDDPPARRGRRRAAHQAPQVRRQPFRRATDPRSNDREAPARRRPMAPGGSLSNRLPPRRRSLEPSSSQSRDNMQRERTPPPWLETHPYADPDQARRLRAQPHRRDPRPLRAQGPAHRRDAARSPPTRTTANGHYAEHTEKPFFGELVDLHHRRPARRA